MAEVLGVASGVAGCISLALELSKTTSDYINQARHASGTIRSFNRELATLQVVLNRLQDEVLTAQKPASRSNAKLLQQLDWKVVQGCSAELLQTREKLRTHLKPGLRQSMLWPFKETETRKLVESLQRHCATFDSAIALETFALSNEILTGTKRNADAVEDALVASQSAVKKLKSIDDRQHAILDETSKIQVGAQHIDAKVQESLNIQSASAGATKDLHETRILDWLSNRDASALHNIARKSHQPGTGKWLLESAHVRRWLDGDKPLLWLYGDQGTGKTVLASTVIENIFDIYNGCTCVLYHYFTFTDKASQLTGGLLRSLIRQLGSTFDPIPREIHDLHGQFAKPGRQPSDDTLLSVLTNLLSLRNGIVLVLDAVDESIDPEGVIRTIASLVRRISRSSKILLSSRPEKNVADSLEDNISGYYLEHCIQGPCHDHDIQHYIEQMLQTDTLLRRKTSEEKNQIQTSLAAKADSMFRWVSCQFDALRNCRTSVALNHALESLPQGLEETYRRIFNRMSESDRHMACAGLQLLLYAKRELFVSEFAEAMVIPASRKFDPDSDRLLDATDILDICAGLISVGPSAKFGRENTMVVRLGHLSVRDYLCGHWPSLGEPSKNDTALPGPFSETYAHQTIALKCLQYLEDCPPDRRTVRIADLQAYPFLDYAASFWHAHAAQRSSLSDQNQLLLRRAAELLQSSNPAFLNWLRIAMPHPWTGTQAFAMFRTLESADVHSPSCYARALNLPLVLDFLLSSGDLLEPQTNSTAGIKVLTETDHEFGIHTLRAPCSDHRCRLFRAGSLDCRGKPDLTQCSMFDRFAIKLRSDSSFPMSDGGRSAVHGRLSAESGPQTSVTLTAHNQPQTGSDKRDVNNASSATNPRISISETPPGTGSVRFGLPFSAHLNKPMQSYHRCDVYYDWSDKRFQLARPGTLHASLELLFHLIGSKLHCAILERSTRETKRLLETGTNPNISAILRARGSSTQEWSISTFALAVITDPFNGSMLTLLSNYGADVDAGVEFLSGGPHAFRVTMMEMLIFEMYNPDSLSCFRLFSQPVHAWLWWFVTKFRPGLDRTALMDATFGGWRLYLAMLCASEWICKSINVSGDDSNSEEFFSLFLSKFREPSATIRHGLGVDGMSTLQLAIVEHARHFYELPSHEHEFSVSSVREALWIALTELTKFRDHVTEILICIYTTILQDVAQHALHDSTNSSAVAELSAHRRFLVDIHRIPRRVGIQAHIDRLTAILPADVIASTKLDLPSEKRWIARPEPLRVRNVELLRFQPWRNGPFRDLLWDTLFQPLIKGQELSYDFNTSCQPDHTHDDLVCVGKSTSSIIEKVIGSSLSLAALNLAHRSEVDAFRAYVHDDDNDDDDDNNDNDTNHNDYDDDEK